MRKTKRPGTGRPATYDRGLYSDHPLIPDQPKPAPSEGGSLRDPQLDAPKGDADSAAERVRDHPIGAAGGAAGGAAAGALSGIPAGPVGSAVGAVVGAVAGGLAGSSSGTTSGGLATPSAKPPGPSARELDTPRPSSRVPRAHDPAHRRAFDFGAQARRRLGPGAQWSDAEPSLRHQWRKLAGGVDLDWPQVRDTVADGWFAGSDPH